MSAKLSICESNQCGYFGPDSRGRVGCLLIDGCPRRYRDHIAIGGGCLSPTPLFEPTERYLAMSEDKKTPKKDPEDIAKSTTKPASQVARHINPMMGAHGQSPDAAGMAMVIEGMAIMSEESRAGVIPWIKARYPEFQ